MSAHVLFNLLNELGKFNNTIVRRLNSIYHMIFCRYVLMDVVS